MASKEILCPYCLQKLGMKEVKMICPICGGEAVPTKSELLFKKAPRCKNKDCHGSYASNKSCSYCEEGLPPDFLGYEKYLRFSILGITGSGKSNFLTTMMHEIRNAQDTPWIFAPMNANTNLMFTDNEREMYENHRPVPATLAGAAPTPQQWRISDKARMTSKIVPSYSLTIFDGAGEDVEHIDDRISRYISGSRTLIILIDPLSLPGVRKSVSSDVYNWSITTEHSGGASAYMVDGLADYIRRNCQISPGKLIEKDVAVVFTKIDAVKSSFGTATVMHQSPHLQKKGFVKTDGDAVGAEIRDWLETHGENAFLNAIDTNFVKNRVHLFGISSFGQPPTSSGQLGKVIPHRVLDPLIWMLSKEGIAPAI